MKRFLSVTVYFAAILTVTTGATAQTVDWGVKGQVNMVMPSKWKNDLHSVKMFNTGFGVMAGGVCNVGLGHNFYIEPGVGLYYDTYAYDDLIIMDEVGDSYTKDPSLYKFGVRVPVTVGYEIELGDNFALRVFTGPQVNYAFYGKVRYPKTGAGVWDSDLWGFHAQRRWDVAWKAGAGIPVGNFVISVEADFGLTNLLHNSPMFGGEHKLKFHENRLGIGLTYYFL